MNEFLAEYDACGAFFCLEEFIRIHGAHDIVICDEGPTNGKELLNDFGANAFVEYLGTESPYYLTNDGLYFIIRPPTKKGKLRVRGGTHIVVFPF